MSAKIWGVINIILSLVLIPGFVKYAMVTLLLVNAILSSYSLPSSSSHSIDSPGLIFIAYMLFASKFLLFCGAIILLLIVMIVQLYQLKSISVNKTVSKKNIIICAMNSLIIILLLKFYPIQPSHVISY